MKQLDLTKPARTVLHWLPARLIDQNYKPSSSFEEPLCLWIITRRNGSEYTELTDKDGRFHGSPILENVPEEPKKHVVYVNLYGNSGRVWIGEAQPDRKTADKAAGDTDRIKRLSCKRIEFVEGEFDE